MDGFYRIKYWQPGAMQPFKCCVGLFGLDGGQVKVKGHSRE